MTVQERAPLQPAESTFLEPYKSNTSIRRRLLETARWVDVMLALDRLFGDENVRVVALPASWGCYVQIDAQDEAHSRRLVGRLIRLFHMQPRIDKIGDDQLRSVFVVDGVEVQVDGYKPKTCRYEEVDVVVPATEEKVEVTPAQPERVERRRILVCDPPAEQAVAEAIADIARETTAEEVPF